MSEPNYADGMTWFDVPVVYPNRPEYCRRETLRILALNAETARREAEDDVWHRLESETNGPGFPVPGQDYIVIAPAIAVTDRSGGRQDWIVAASINDRGDSHGQILFGPYDSSRAAEDDACFGILRNQARMGYSASGGEIVPIVRRMTAAEAAHPQWLNKPETANDPPPAPGRYASTTPEHREGTTAP